MSLAIYGYGSGEVDQLGLGEDILESKRPRQILPNENINIKVNIVVCGTMHTLVLSNMGTLYSWGCNDDFALGREGVDNLPVEVKLPVPVNKISAGDSHSVAYNTVLNKVYIWGQYRNTDGKFGDPIKTPTELDRKHWKGEVQKVVCGSNHTLMLSSGKVYTWGNHEFGQIAR